MLMRKIHKRLGWQNKEKKKKLSLKRWKAVQYEIIKIVDAYSFMIV
jgi:hypothetical protein